MHQDEYDDDRIETTSTKLATTHKKSTVVSGSPNTNASSPFAGFTTVAPSTASITAFVPQMSVV